MTLLRILAIAAGIVFVLALHPVKPQVPITEYQR
jgi:hypothetical protein